MQTNYIHFKVAELQVLREIFDIVTDLDELDADT